jgi:hypothetical protein
LKIPEPIFWPPARTDFLNMAISEFLNLATLVHFFPYKKTLCMNHIGFFLGCQFLLVNFLKMAKTIPLSSE